MIYLASPYSHPEASIRQSRFELACFAAGIWTKSGEHIYSPIAHSHPIAELVGLPKDWFYWNDQNQWHLVRCKSIRVLMLHGWRESEGVAAELAIARELGLPISYWLFDGVDLVQA